MVITTWSAADEFVRAEAETDIWAGTSPRPTLVMFEGEVTTMIASGPEGDRTPMSSVVELILLARVLRPGRFVLTAPLPPAPAADEEITVGSITTTPMIVVARASRGRGKERVRVQALPYGRDDLGAPTWKRPRRIHLRKGRVLRRLLVDALRGPAGDELPPPAVVAGYLLDRGYALATADGWAVRYGLGGLADH